MLLAQSERGTISGTVKDASGAVIPDANVAVTNTATNASITMRTGGTGDYTAPSLPVGPYSVRVEKEGFRPSSITGITVNAATSVRVDVTMEVGTALQAVEVQAQAMQLHTEDAKSSVTITNKWLTSYR